MILSSHIIMGAAVGRIFPSSPILGFLAGLLSHYAMDAVPHWEYTLPSIFERKKTGAGKVPIPEVAIAGIDGVLGIILSLLIFPSGIHDTQILSFTLGMLGGVLPDGLQFLYFFYKREPLKTHQKIHDMVHSHKRLRDLPIFGIPLQIAIVLMFIFVSYLLVP